MCYSWLGALVEDLAQWRAVSPSEMADPRRRLPTSSSRSKYSIHASYLQPAYLQ